MARTAGHLGETRLQTLAFCAGLLIALTATADVTHAPLVGRHLADRFGGAPLLICEYAGSHATFEILSLDGQCAPYLDVQ